MIRSIRPSRSLLTLVLSWLLLTVTAMAESPEVAQANGHLKRAEANLKLVNDAIGHLTQPPKGSAARLAKMRLDQAFGDLKPAGELLSKLKQGDGLADASKRYNDDIQLYEKLRGILTGGPSPEPKPKPPEPAPDSSKGKQSGQTGGRGDVRNEDLSMKDLREGEWGNLPPRLRDELAESLSETFNPVYRAATEAFYRRIAELSQQQAEGEE